MYEYKPAVGAHIEDVAAKLTELAHRRCEPVCADFNGIRLTANVVEEYIAPDAAAQIAAIVGEYRKATRTDLMTPALLRRYADGINGGWGPGLQPGELAAWLRNVADAMEVPLDVTVIDSRPGRCCVELTGTREQVAAVARRGVSGLAVALVPVGGVA